VATAIEQSSGYDFGALKWLEEFIGGGSPFKRVAVLIPTGPLLLLLKQRLFRSLPRLAGVSFFTPAGLREELANWENFQAKLFPEECFIPWRRRHAAAAVHDIGRLRPSERHLLENLPDLERYEKVGFFTAAAFDASLEGLPGRIHWERACSFGFPEGDWDHFSLLRKFTHSSGETFHCFRRSPNLECVVRWREIWNYRATTAGRGGEPRGRRELLPAGGPEEAAEILRGRILELISSGGRSGEKCGKIAVVFSHSYGLSHAVQSQLNISGIGCANFIEPERPAALDPLRWSWLRYQRRQKRRECLELLRASAAAGRMDLDGLEAAIDATIAHCRKELCDDCGATTVRRLNFWWRPLPDGATPLEFFDELCADFPEWKSLQESVDLLAVGHNTVSRDVFLDYWEALLGREEPGQMSLEQLNAPVHLLTFASLPGHWYDHLILADVTEANHPTTIPGALLDGTTCSKINATLKNFYYVTPAERIALRDSHLSEIQWEPGTVDAISVAGGNLLEGGQLHGMAQPFVEIFSGQEDGSSLRSWRLRELGRRVPGNAPERQIFPDKKFLQMPVHGWRREWTRPFGAHDFGFGENGEAMGEWAEQIPCKAWELAVKFPERAWLKYVLHLTAAANSIFEDLPQLLGTAVHGALATALLDGKPTGPNFPRYSPWQRAFHRQCEGYVDDLWSQVRKFRESLGDAKEFVEEDLEGEVTIGGATLSLHGRCDWLIQRADGTQILVDFKTGNSVSGATPASLCAGNFLQLALYGLLLETQGRGQCALLIFSPFARGKSIEMEKLTAEADEKLAAFWKFFTALHGRMNFGYRSEGQVAAPFLAYSHSPIPNEIIEARRRASGFSFGPTSGEILP
jgi:hypothetical protein